MNEGESFRDYPDGLPYTAAGNRVYVRLLLFVTQRDYAQRLNEAVIRLSPPHLNCACRPAIMAELGAWDE
jgi:hypothetical protein